MREIKFRGKTLSGKWVYGDLVHFTNTEGIDASVIITEHQATVESNDFDYALCYARNEFKIVIPESVGQFTGLHDKNGKEIYEGDIVSHPWKDPIFGDLVETGQFVHSTICFNNGAFVVNYCLQGEYIYLQDFVRLKCLEVIGNIHDNPELLKTE